MSKDIFITANIKQLYLRDKEVLLKKGHTIIDDLDDFFLWCTANKIVLSDLKEDIQDAVVEEAKAVSMYTKMLHSIDTDEDRDTALDLIHIRKDEEEHKQLLENLENNI